MRKGQLASFSSQRGVLFTGLVCAVVFSPRVLKTQNFQNVAQVYGVSSFAEGQYGNGISLYDWNFDGYDDIVLCRENEPVKFYRNTAGTFQEVNFNGVEIQGRVNSVSWVDYNNDDNPDLAFNIGGGAFTLFRNEGDFQFTNVSSQCGVSQIIAEGYGQSWGDFDNDGYLDLYLSNYQTAEITPLRTNYLYRNNGDGTFTNVTDLAGVGNGYKMTFLSVWLDYDKDGFSDLFVLNDRFSFYNYLYHNNGDGTFTDVSEESGLSQNFEPMSGTVGDYNNDNWLDIFVSNGNEGNKLYTGSESGFFEEVAAEQGVKLFLMCWSAVWIDANGDMNQDLTIATSDTWINDSDVFYFENSGGSFFLNQSGDLLEQGGLTYAMGKADFNNDFKSDLLSYGASPRGVAIWETNGPSHDAIKLALKGTISNKDGIGAFIEVYSNDIRQTHYTLNGEQYLSQNSQWHIFSTQSNSFADSVIVRWPSGIVDKYNTVPAMELLILTEGETQGPNLSEYLNPAYCNGDTIELNAGEADSYLWNTGETTPTIQVTQSGDYSVEVMIGELIIISDTVSLEFIEPIDYQILISNPTCFDSQEAQAHIEDLNGNIIQSVVWNQINESNFYIGSPIDSIHYQFVDSNTCISEGYFDFIIPDSITINVSTEFVSQQTGCEDTWSGNADVYGGAPPYQVTWEFYLIGEMAPFLSEYGISFQCIPSESDLYLKCIVKDTNLCTRTSEQFLNLNSPGYIEESATRNLFHPNPFKNSIMLDALPQVSNVKIYDFQGRLVKNIDLMPNEQIIVLEDLSIGIYTLIQKVSDKRFYQLAIKNE